LRNASSPKMREKREPDKHVAQPRSSLMRRQALRIAVLMCALGAGEAFSCPTGTQLPPWAAHKWQVLASARGLEFSCRLNPFVLHADFDGDRRQDIAVLVKRSSDGKQGIALLIRGARRAVALGAGKSFGNGGDDFAWLDSWQVEEKGTLQRSGTSRLPADGLSVAKDSSASALIYLKNGVPTWQQRGD
jgi:hypothetical protein